MKIPLIVNTIIDKYSNQQLVEIWRNSKREFIKAPFLPYFYSSYKLNEDYISDAIEEKVEKTLLSTLEKKSIYKYSFPNTRYVSQYRENDSIESDMLYTDRVLIDKEDFFLQYPNNNDLKILFFDIEVDTTGIFPTPKRNAIIAIAAKSSDGNKKTFISKTFDDDKEILKRFFKFYSEVDPDIIVHYNGNKFDIPYIIERMKINNIPIDLWSRNGKVPYIFKNKMTLCGRISFDIYNEVLRDQTIFGIKNHKMKTIAKWLKYPEEVIEVPYSEMRSLVGTTKLKSYIQSDVKITEFLFNIYFRNVLALAEMQKIPLNLMVDAAPSFISKIIHGRTLNMKMNIISDLNNGQRNPLYIKKKQGALCDTYLPGLYNQPISKVDYSSEYPRVVQTFNISPETVKILRYDTFGKYKFNIDNPNKYIFSIPDSVANKNIVIEIDMSKRGFLAQFMDDVLKDRIEVKKKMKSLTKGSSEYESLNVIQNALKIVANVQTGYHGQEFAHFGSLACYNLITGMGRFYLMMAKDKIENLGSKAIAIDTDGIYNTNKINIEELNKYLDDETMRLFKLKNYLHMEQDNYDAAFFRKTKGKHYVLKEGNKITFHGQSFKGSHMPKFFDEILINVAKNMFDGKVLRDIDIKSYPIDSLIQSIKVKDENEYKSDNSISMQLIKAIKKEIPNIELVDHDQLSYIETDKGHELVLPDKTYGNINWRYYQNIVDKIYERLQIEDTKQIRWCQI